MKKILVTLFTLILFLGNSSPALAAIAFGSAREGGGGASPLTVYLTTAGSNLTIVLAIQEHSSATETVSGVTWNGNTMTNVAHGQTGAARYTSLWMISGANATAASSTFVVTASASIGDTAAAYYTGTAATQPDNDTTHTGSSSGAMSCALTVNTANSWIVSLLNDDQGVSHTAGTNTDNRVAPAGTGFSYSDTNSAQSTGSQTMNWTLGGGPSNYICDMASIAPFVAPTGKPPFNPFLWILGQW